MTTETAQIEILIRELLKLLTFRHEAIRIEPEEFEGQVTWYVQVPAEDMGRVVGNNGACISALNAIIKATGQFLAPEKPHRIHLEEPGRAHGRHKPDPDEYDLESFVPVLEQTLSAVGVQEYQVSCHAGKQGAHSYLLNILVRSYEDYLLLMAPSDYSTLIGDMGTVFRSAAGKDGVKLSLHIERVEK